MSGPQATVTRTNVLAGPGQLWHGLADSAVLPDDADVALPLETTDGWTDAGGTDGGLTVTVSQSFFAKRVDQVPDKLGHVLTERDVTVATSLAEGTLENLSVALNLDPADVVTGAGTKRLDLPVGQNGMLPLTDLAVVVDGWAPGGGGRRRRVLLRRVNSVENVQSAYKKDGLWLFPVTFNALYIDATTSPVSWIDQTTDDASS